MEQQNFSKTTQTKKWNKALKDLIKVTSLIVIILLASYLSHYFQDDRTNQAINAVSIEFKKNDSILLHKVDSLRELSVALEFKTKGQLELLRIIRNNTEETLINSRASMKNNDNHIKEKDYVDKNISKSDAAAIDRVLSIKYEPYD